MEIPRSVLIVVLLVAVGFCSACATGNGPIDGVGLVADFVLKHRPAIVHRAGCPGLRFEETRTGAGTVVLEVYPECKNPPAEEAQP